MTIEGEKCAMVSSEGSGFWFLEKCAQPHSFICEFPRSGYVAPTTTTTTVAPEAQCEDTYWTKWNDHCYQLFEEARSFENAELFCQSKGGHLMSLGSVEEESQLYNFVYDYEFFWLGLRQSDSDDGGYYWTDGSALEYSYFKGKSF